MLCFNGFFLRHTLLLLSHCSFGPPSRAHLPNVHWHHLSLSKPHCFDTSFSRILDISSFWNCSFLYSALLWSPVLFLQISFSWHSFLVTSLSCFLTFLFRDHSFTVRKILDLPFLKKASLENWAGDLYTEVRSRLCSVSVFGVIQCLKSMRKMFVTGRWQAQGFAPFFIRMARCENVGRRGSQWEALRSCFVASAVGELGLRFKNFQNIETFRDVSWDCFGPDVIIRMPSLHFSCGRRKNVCTRCWKSEVLLELWRSLPAASDVGFLTLAVAPC